MMSWLPLWFLLVLCGIGLFVFGMVFEVLTRRFQEWIIRREEAEEPRGFPVKPIDQNKGLREGERAENDSGIRIPGATKETRARF